RGGEDLTDDRVSWHIGQIEVGEQHVERPVGGDVEGLTATARARHLGALDGEQRRQCPSYVLLVLDEEDARAIEPRRRIARSHHLPHRQTKCQGFPQDRPVRRSVTDYCETGVTTGEAPVGASGSVISVCRRGTSRSMRRHTCMGGKLTP